MICTKCVDENIQPPMKAIVMYNGTGFCLTHYKVIKNKEEVAFKIRSTPMVYRYLEEESL